MPEQALLEMTARVAEPKAVDATGSTAERTLGSGKSESEKELASWENCPGKVDDCPSWEFQVQARFGAQFLKGEAVLDCARIR